MAAMEAANAHYQNGHHQQSGPPLPASPTLTNPDMILPDYERSDSPDTLDLNRGHPSLEVWKSAQSTAASSIHHVFTATSMGGPPYGPVGPITPTTPIIYGNGTMLSDIGEVTEVESTIEEKPSPPRTKLSSGRRSNSPGRIGDNNEALRSSPTMRGTPTLRKSKQILRAARERRDSIDSNSTITTENHKAHYADIDDSASVGDSVFQGDDEQSVASSYVEETDPNRLGASKIDNSDRLSTYSTSSISRRAEEILANAKKRLSAMEGNLNRARSTLYSTSRFGLNGATSSTPVSPFQRTVSATYPRNGSVDSTTSSSNQPTVGHTRMSSDIAMRNGLPYRVSIPRSQSALGAAGGYRQPLTTSKSSDHIRQELGYESSYSFRTSRSSISVREPGVKPLTEEEVRRLGEADPATQNARLEAFLNPDRAHESTPRHPSRSPTAAQVQDIKEQMRDLKGKISTLREQARADSLKKRSLQSLRTPSPFTHSQIGQWYAEPRSNRASVLGPSSSSNRSFWNSEDSSVTSETKDDFSQSADQRTQQTHYVESESASSLESPASAMPDVSSPLSMRGPEPGLHSEANEDYSDMVTENGEYDEDTDEQVQTAEESQADSVSESGESLYHDAVQFQIRHEDREDAFDYEHFFLHSAMGTMSQELMRRRGSTSSYSSEDSVETTRGPVAASETESETYARHRRNSDASVSTFETFATAQERHSIKSPQFDESSRAASVQSVRYRPGSSAAANRLSLPAASNSHQPGARDSDGSISPIAEETSSSPHVYTSTRRDSVIHRPISAQAAIRGSSSIASFDSIGTNRSFPLVNKPSVSIPPRAASAAAVARGHSHSSSTATAKRAHSTGVLTPRGGSVSSGSSRGSRSRDGDNEDDDDDWRSVTARLMSEAIAQLNRQQLRKKQGHAARGSVPSSTVGDDIVSTCGDKEGSIEREKHDLLAGLPREDRYLVERVVASLGRCVMGLTENGRASSESRMFRRRIEAARRALEGHGPGLDNSASLGYGPSTSTLEGPDGAEKDSASPGNRQ